MKCMEKLRQMALSAVLMLTAGATAATAFAAPDVRRYETVAFDTYASVSIYPASNARADAAVDEIFDLLAEMHIRFSPWLDGEAKRVNDAIAAGALPIAISDDMRELIELSQQFAADSDQLFNPSIGHLVDLWELHNDPPRPPPDEAIEDWVRTKPLMSDIVIRDGQIVAAARSVNLTFGAVAKGYALDKARAILRRHGAQNALLDFGGNIMAVGARGGRAWRVGLAPAGRDNPLAVINLHDGETVATSGVGERFFEYEGERYHHIFDPRDGRPPRHVFSVMVVTEGDAANGGASGDALATALLIADDDEARRFAANYGARKIWRIGADGADHITPAMRARLDEN